jgi:predicted PurR-regulated permease PerM
MTMQRQMAFWMGGLALTGVLLYALSGILLPFVAGMILAYLLDPLAKQLERTGMGRLAATLIVLTLFLVVFVLGLVLLAPLAAHQIREFVASFPEIMSRVQAIVNERGEPLLRKLGADPSFSDVKGSLGTVVGQGATWIGGFLGSVLSGGQALLGLVSLLVITPVVTFYLLYDWNHMVATVDTWLPRRQAPVIRDLLSQIDRVMGGFLRGQALVCLFLGTFYALGLGLLGVKSGILIGAMTGVLSFIPYVGSITGLLVGVSVALAQFWPDWTLPLAVLTLFIAGQFIEGNFLTPKLVGASVGLHPVWLLFALLAFGSLFGFVGLLLAVPIAAILGVLTRFALQHYLKSPLYDNPKSKKTGSQTTATPATPHAQESL